MIWYMKSWFGSTISTHYLKMEISNFELFHSMKYWYEFTLCNHDTYMSYVYEFISLKGKDLTDHLENLGFKNYYSAAHEQ
jgi:hypothetical protein